MADGTDKTLRHETKRELMYMRSAQDGARRTLETDLCLVERRSA